MEPVSVNTVAVVVAGVVSMAIGFLWYGPLFGKRWMKLVGMSERDKKDAQASMGKTYVLSFLATLVMAYVLAYIVAYSGAATAMQGAQAGFWSWLGFVATTGLNQYLFSVKPKPWELYFVDQGHLLGVLLVQGMILASWA